MYKVLPINPNPIIKFECWTYQRVAIISAYREFDDWFVHHLNNLYITSEYDCDYGKFGTKYNIVSHYEEVLEIEEHLYTEFPEEDVIDIICEAIDNGKYIIIDVDASCIYDKIQNSFISQLLLYGYNSDRKSFVFPSFENKWILKELSWDTFIKAFRSRKAFSNNQSKAFLSRQNPTPIFFLKPKKECIPKIHLGVIYDSLKATISLAESPIAFANLDNDSFYFYEGVLGVYSGLIEMMGKVINSELSINDLGYDHGFASGFYKVSELNLMAFVNLKRICKQTAISLPESYFANYFEMIKSFEKLKNSATLYSVNHRKEHLMNCLETTQRIKNQHMSLLLQFKELLELYFTT